MTIPISWGYSISCILKQPNLAVASHQLQPTAKGFLRYPLGPLRQASQLMVIRTALNLIVARSHGQPPLLRKLMNHDPRPTSKANVDTVWGDSQWKKHSETNGLRKVELKFTPNLNGCTVQSCTPSFWESRLNYIGTSGDCSALWLNPVFKLVWLKWGATGWLSPTCFRI